MKRFVVIALGVAMLLVSPVGVAASATKLVGTAEWSGGTFADPSTTTHVHGTFDGPLGRGTYNGTLKGSPVPTTDSCGPVCQSVTGSIVFSGHRGSFTGVVQPGSVLAITEIPSHSFRAFDLMLGVTDGTRGYAHADGVLSLSYTSTWAHFFDSDGNFINEITDEGTLTGSLR